MTSLLIQWVLGRSGSCDHLTQELIWEDILLQIEVIASGVNSSNALFNNQLLLIHIDPFSIHQTVIDIKIQDELVT